MRICCAQSELKVEDIKEEEDFPSVSTSSPRRTSIPLKAFEVDCQAQRFKLSFSPPRTSKTEN